MISGRGERATTPGGSAEGEEEERTGNILCIMLHK